MAWSPVPDKNSNIPVKIPKCWVPCNGSVITDGIWSGEKTPDINNQNRYSYAHRACQFQIVAKTDRHAIAVELVSAKTGISSNYVTTF